MIPGPACLALLLQGKTPRAVTEAWVRNKVPSSYILFLRKLFLPNRNLNIYMVG